MNNKPNTAEPVRRPQRRWFQFRLRTLLALFVVLGAASAYVAHEAKIVHERKAMEKWIIDRGGKVYHDGALKPPILRRLLGDDGCKINLPAHLSAEERHRIDEVFPDAWFVESPLQ